MGLRDLCVLSAGASRTGCADDVQGRVDSPDAVCRVASSKVGAKLLNKDSISRKLMYLAKSTIVCGHTFT